MFNLTDVVVFVRLPKAVKEIVKSSYAGSVIAGETTEDGVQRSYFKQPAPSGNGIYFQNSAAFKFGFIKIPPLFLPKTLDKTLKKCGASRLLIKKALFTPAQPASIF